MSHAKNEIPIPRTDLGPMGVGDLPLGVHALIYVDKDTYTYLLGSPIEFHVFAYYCDEKFHVRAKDGGEIVLSQDDVELVSTMLDGKPFVTGTTIIRRSWITGRTKEVTSYRLHVPVVACKENDLYDVWSKMRAAGTVLRGESRDNEGFEFKVVGYSGDDELFLTPVATRDESLFVMIPRGEGHYRFHSLYGRRWRIGDILKIRQDTFF